MADSIFSMSNLPVIMSRIHSTYLFNCQCAKMSKNRHFNAFSAQPAEARGKEQRNVAEYRERFTCQARQRLLRRLLLIYLSTLLILTQPRRHLRLYLTNLQKCLKEKKFCANRALGRLFRTPLMSWSGISTSRGLPTTTGNCTGSRSRAFRRRNLDTAITTLRLEQKTSGLFDSGNRQLIIKVPIKFQLRAINFCFLA